MVVLDELDRRILYQLDLDCRQSNARIARKVKARKDTVAFRIRRLIKRGIITRFTTEINSAKFGYATLKVYLQVQNFTDKQEKEFFQYLKSFRQTGWIVSCSGRWDVLVVYWAKSPFEFYQELLKILNRFSKHIVHKEICQSMNWFWYNRKWLIEDATPVGIEYGGIPGHYKLDDLDHAVLRCLIDDGRASAVSISEKAGTSPQNVLNKIKKLKKAGIITKFGIDIDYKQLGITFCKAFVYLQNITQERLQELYDYCLRQPQIFALVVTLGPWDLELEFEVHDFEEMTRIMNGLRKKFGDMVKNYESVIVTAQTPVIHIEE